MTTTTAVQAKRDELDRSLADLVNRHRFDTPGTATAAIRMFVFAELDAAGVELDDRDRRQWAWLCDGEPHTVASLLAPVLVLAGEVDR
jgi:hypothetical protein